MAKITKKLKQTVITIRMFDGKTLEHVTPVGLKIRNKKKYVYEQTGGTGVYVSSYEKETTYCMDMEFFLEHAEIIETGKEVEEEEEE